MTSKERQREYNKRYYANHRKEIIAKQKDYYYEHREERIEYQRGYDAKEENYQRKLEFNRRKYKTPKMREYYKKYYQKKKAEQKRRQDNVNND